MIGLIVNITEILSMKKPRHKHGFFIYLAQTSYGSAANAQLR